MNPTTIKSTTGVDYTILKSRLVEETNYSKTDAIGRSFNLASLGRILRRYKTTKKRLYNDQKVIRIFLNGNESAFGVKVYVNGAQSLGIGCVHFVGTSAQTLRRAALKSTKVKA